MPARPVLLSIFTLALLAPVMYRRFQRRTGAPRATLAHRKGRIAVALQDPLRLVGVLGAPPAPRGPHPPTARAASPSPSWPPWSSPASSVAPLSRPTATGTAPRP